MLDVIEVGVDAVDPQRFSTVLDPEPMAVFQRAIDQARAGLGARAIWNVNSTAKGGGVAEMLAALLPYARGAGVDARWLVIGGDDPFFAITKRIHNRLHGSPGDGKGLGDDDRSHYDAVLAAQAAQVGARVRPGDVVILHDPQTAGLVPAMRDAGARVVWRCHIGTDTPNEEARDTWRFLLPYTGRADICVFSRQAFVWDGLAAGRVRVVAPSIDPFSAKNHAMDDVSVHAILGAAGVIAVGGGSAAVYTQADGSPGTVRHRATVLETARADTATPLVVQISRWDRLKDPLGVLDGFVEAIAPVSDAHLLLAGPSVVGVSDDPEGAAAFREVANRWEELAEPVRSRVHLVCLPMDDEDENAAMVNALQRQARVVVQKSLAEGFGLTVAEAMWKSRPVVASRLGGIQDQIEDGISGILLDDARNHAEFGTAVRGVLSDRERADRMGVAAHARVQREFLASRHLGQYVQICSELG